MLWLWLRLWLRVVVFMMLVSVQHLLLLTIDEDKSISSGATSCSNGSEFDLLVT
jgi:hypothetical protein